MDGIFTWLLKLQQGQDKLQEELKEEHYSLKNRVELLELLNDRAEGAIRKKDEEIRQLQHKLTRAHRTEIVLTSERDVARKEVDSGRFIYDAIKRERDQLDSKLRETDEKRRRLRKSYQELTRCMAEEVLQDENVQEAMDNVKDFLKN